jgi:hypothetical protein
MKMNLPWSAISRRLGPPPQACERKKLYTRRDGVGSFNKISRGLLPFALRRLRMGRGDGFAATRVFFLVSRPVQPRLYRTPHYPEHDPPATYEASNAWHALNRAAVATTCKGLLTVALSLHWHLFKQCCLHALPPPAIIVSPRTADATAIAREAHGLVRGRWQHQLCLGNSPARKNTLLRSYSREIGYYLR